MTLALPSPPSYEYKTVGPWMVTQERDDRAVTWVLYNLSAAVVRLFLLPPRTKTPPDRRVVIDARGVTVLGISPDGSPRMVGTREACDALFQVLSGVDQTDAVIVDVLEMAESLRSMDGVMIQ